MTTSGTSNTQCSLIQLNSDHAALAAPAERFHRGDLPLPGLPKRPASHGMSTGPACLLDLPPALRCARTKSRKCGWLLLMMRSNLKLSTIEGGHQARMGMFGRTTVRVLLLPMNETNPTATVVHSTLITGAASSGRTLLVLFSMLKTVNVVVCNDCPARNPPFMPCVCLCPFVSGRCLRERQVEPSHDLYRLCRKLVVLSMSLALHMFLFAGSTSTLPV